MSDEFIEFRIPVSEEDREHFRDLTDLMSEYRGALYEAINPLSGEVNPVRVRESYRSFMDAFTGWINLCTRLLILEEDSALTGERGILYPLKEGVEGYYKERVLGFLGQAQRIESTFSLYNSTSGGEELRPEDDDLPF